MNGSCFFFPVVGGAVVGGAVVAVVTAKFAQYYFFKIFHAKSPLPSMQSLEDQIRRPKETFS